MFRRHPNKLSYCFNLTLTGQLRCMKMHLYLTNNVMGKHYALAFMRLNWS